MKIDEVLFNKMYKKLNPREEKILRLRYGFGYEKERTLNEIALMFSVSRQRISQIQIKALKKIRIMQILDEIAELREELKYCMDDDCADIQEQLDFAVEELKTLKEEMV